MILLGRSDSDGVAYAGDFRPGGTLESLQVPVLVGAGSVDYEDFADRPLVINFFASWCPSCISEMPAFEQVHRQLGDRVRFLGVSQSDSRDASIELARRAGITYPTGFDPVGSFFHATGVLGMPTTIFVRAGGKIADVWVGPLASVRMGVGERLPELDAQTPVADRVTAVSTLAEGRTSARSCTSCGIYDLRRSSSEPIAVRQTY